MVDGTSITDGALARKLEAAVKRDAAIKVRIAYDTKQTARFDVIRAIAKKAGVTAVEVSEGIDSPTMVLSISAAGTLIFGARVLEDDEIDTALASLAKRTKRIVIAPEKSTPAATVEAVIARCKAAGLSDVVMGP
jgi:biopolymer transport protein ExbD